MPELQPGFYWIKYSEEADWTIGEYNPTCEFYPWQFLGDEVGDCKVYKVGQFIGTQPNQIS